MWLLRVDNHSFRVFFLCARSCCKSVLNPFRSFNTPPLTLFFNFTPRSARLAAYQALCYSLLLFHQHVNERLCRYHSEAILWTANSRDGIRYQQWANSNFNSSLPSRQGRPCLYIITLSNLLANPTGWHFFTFLPFNLSNLSNLFKKWRISDSNRWPPACKAGALASWANPP